MSIVKARDKYGVMRDIPAFRGKKGDRGENGVPATHSWNGTTLTVTSASGTSSADLKGPPGKTPIKGIDYFTDADKAELMGGFSSIPDYVIAAADEVAKKVLALQNENTFSFIAISDVHVNVGLSGRDTQTQESIAHAGMAINHIASQIGIDFMCNLGDNLYGVNEDVDLAKQENLILNQAVYEAFRTHPQFRLVGNHEANLWNHCVPTNAIYGMNGRYNTFDVVGDTKMRGYGYKDFEQYKLRVIGLNTSDYINNKGGYCMSAEQKLWFMSALDLSAKSDAEDWQILILSHIPLDYPDSDENTHTDIPAVLEAYQKGSSVTIAAGTYNYSGKNAAQIIANIHGHIHNFSTGNMVGNGLVRVCTPNTCFYNSGASGTGTDELYQPNEIYDKTSGTAEDTTVTIYTVDTANKIIYSTNYGAGYDREISYYVEDGKPTWDIAQRTAVTNMYSEQTKAKTLSESEYYYGAAASGMVDYRKVKDVIVSGNNVTFTNTGERYYGIGLPYHLNAGKTYIFSAYVSPNSRVRALTFDADGMVVADSVVSCDCCPDPSVTFTAPTDEAAWVMLILDAETAEGTYAFTDISLVEK